MACIFLIPFILFSELIWPPLLTFFVTSRRQKSNHAGVGSPAEESILGPAGSEVMYGCCSAAVRMVIQRQIWFKIHGKTQRN